MRILATNVKQQYDTAEDEHFVQRQAKEEKGLVHSPSRTRKVRDNDDINKEENNGACSGFWSKMPDGSDIY